jgi:probable rRNA maturation factor
MHFVQTSPTRKRGAPAGGRGWTNGKPRCASRRHRNHMPKLSIAFANRQRLLRIDRRRLQRLSRSVLIRELVESADISVAIVDDSEIHALNRQFLNHDFPTDVISFPLDGNASSDNRMAANALHGTAPVRTNLPLPRLVRQTARPTGRIVRRGAGKVISGEIVMSAETAARAAADCNSRPEYELSLYLVHGLLHLCGYDDLSPKERRLMRRREAEALREWIP